MAKLFVWFMIYSFVGWSYETVLYSVKNKRFEDSGMLYGCYCPIYGLGALAILFVCSGVNSPMLIFLGSMTVCCLLEYASSWAIEKITGARWWDYSDWPLNINGRICLFGGMAFGIMAVLFMMFLHPTVAEMTDRFPEEWTARMAAVLFTVLALDIAATVRRCRRMERKDGEISIVRKLPFDFAPHFEIPRFGNNMRGITAAVRDRGSNVLEFLREKLEEILRG